MNQYIKLIRQFPLRPLQDDADLADAIRMTDEILDRPDWRDRPRPVQDYLDVLSDLVRDYETKTIHFDPVGDADMLRFLIENKGVTQAQTATDAGIAESTISAILSGKRKLNRGQIAKLARYFHLGPGVFAVAE